MISPVTSHSEVQEGYHSRVQDPGPTTTKARFWDREVRGHKKITTISRAQRTRYLAKSDRKQDQQQKRHGAA